MKTQSRFFTSLAQESSFFFAVPALIWQVLFFYAPLFFVLYLSLTHFEHHEFSSSFTLAHYAPLLQWTYLKIMVRSVIMAFATVFLCALGGYPVAYYIACRAQKMKKILLFLLIVPFWTNFVVQIYAWFFLLERNGLINTILMHTGFIQEPLYLLNTSFAVYLVMFYCYLPFMVMPIYSALASFDMKLLEASSDLGASAWQTWLRITLPLSAPGLKTGFFLVFVPSFGEYLIPELMGGGKVLYLGSLISHYFLIARSMNEGAALTVIGGAVLACSAVVLHLFVNYVIARAPRG